MRVQQVDARSSTSTVGAIRTGLIGMAPWVHGLLIAAIVISAPRLTYGDIVFSDSFDTDTTSNYIKYTADNPLGLPMTMSYAEAEQALRFSGNQQGSWYVDSLSGAYDGSVSARVTFEILGTPDHGGIGNGLGVQVGLRVNPGPWPYPWGVWGGLYTIWGEKYAIIDDGAPGVWATAVPYAYQQGQTYDLQLDLSGSQATLYVNGIQVVQRNGITQPSSGTGSAGIWVSDGDSSSTLSSFLVDDLRVDSSSPNVVPVPGAFLLGSIGLSYAGWLLRRRTT